MASVNLNDLYKTFDGKKYVVDGVSISIDDGTFLVIVGSSGCGKSTTLNMIAGLESASSGDIFINEINVNGVEPKDRNIAMVFQSHALYPHLTVYGNLAFALKVKHVNKKIIDKKVHEIATMLELTDLLKRKPHQLSGGQKQRVAIGRAMIREPLAFLMDEPLSNLDANLKSSMREELKRLHKELQATYIYVTHDQIEAMTLASQLAVMSEGKIQQIGTPYDIYMNPINIFVAKFMGTHPLNLYKCSMSKRQDEFTIEFFDGTLYGCFEPDAVDFNEVYIAIRPEGFEYSADKSGMRLKVLSAEVLGSDTLFKCITSGCQDGSSINVLLPTQSTRTSVDEIYVKPKSNMIMLFSVDTGQRMPLQVIWR